MEKATTGTRKMLIKSLSLAFHIGPCECGLNARICVAGVFMEGPTWRARRGVSQSCGDPDTAQPIKLW